jgi:hypothetical protein
MTALLRTAGQTSPNTRAIAPALVDGRAASGGVSRVAARRRHPSPHVVSGTISVPATMSDHRDCAISFAEPQTMADT